MSIQCNSGPLLTLIAQGMWREGALLTLYGMLMGGTVAEACGDRGVEEGTTLDDALTSDQATHTQPQCWCQRVSTASMVRSRSVAQVLHHLQ